MTLRNESKGTISTNRGLGLLQIVSKSDIVQYASKDIGPLKEQSIPYKGVKFSPQ